jgi:NTE family protein
LIYRLLLIVLFCVAAYASERPKIGLVLSGGGARGGAHLGVIKAFEKHRIPIDAIVGTSMGSLIGGLYAAGHSSEAIETLLTTTEWSKVISIDYERIHIPFRRKLFQLEFPGNAKMGVNRDNEIVFGTGLFKRQMMLQFLEHQTYNVSDIDNFDHLNIPFRAVASNLENGEAVVLGSGSLAKSIYASIAIPGGFDPIVIDGKTLVDGGVADNLPLDVMRREMHVDIIILVDISTPFDEKQKFNNYLSIMGRLSDILMRKNVEETIASLRPNEILITPELGDITPLDSDKYPQIIRIGEAAVSDNYDAKLAGLSLSDERYAAYTRQRERIRSVYRPVIDRIVLQNSTYLNDRAILSRLHIETGKPLDFEQLQSDLSDIYNLTIFDDVGYAIDEENGITTLRIITTPNWDMNGEIRFAFGFEDNFSGHSDYSVSMEYTMFGLSRYGGEWRNRISTGQSALLQSEWYQPLEPLQRFYVRSELHYQNKKVYFSPTLLGQHNIKAELDDSLTMNVRNYGVGAAAGINVGHVMQIETGLRLREVEPELQIIIADGNVTYDKLHAKQKSRQFYAALDYDTLDNADFPKTGCLGKVLYAQELENMGSDTDYNQMYGEFLGAYSIGKHTLIPKIRLGGTWGSSLDKSQDFDAFYTLGGLFNLSGLPTNAVTGDHIAFASALYRYQLRDRGFFGALSMPVYIGGSLEAGKAWYSIIDGSYKNSDTIPAASVFVAADTILGPIYLAFGAADSEYYSVYFSLGSKF